MRRSTIIASFAALGIVALAAVPAEAQTSPPLATKAGAPATIPPGPTDNGPPPPRQHKTKAKANKKGVAAPAVTAPAQ